MDPVGPSSASEPRLRDDEPADEAELSASSYFTTVEAPLIDGYAASTGQIARPASHKHGRLQVLLTATADRRNWPVNRNPEWLRLGGGRSNVLVRVQPL